MTDKVYIGDVGTEIILDCGIDVSSATVQKILIRKPNGTTTEWSAEIHNTNYLKHVSVDGDFDVVGNYIAQAYVEMPGWKGRGLAAIFSVYGEFR